MKKYLIISGIAAAVILILALFFTLRFNQDEKNKLSRKAVEYLDGNYSVTYANGPASKTWTIRNGKVTTGDKGYYFFWDANGHYIQTPVTNTFIEEIK